MLRIVRISEKDSNRIIAESSVILEFDDASDQDYFDKAGQDAINDGIVNPQIRSDYKIEYADWWYFILINLFSSIR